MAPTVQYVLNRTSLGCASVVLNVSDNGYYGAGGPLTAQTALSVGVVVRTGLPPLPVVSIAVTPLPFKKFTDAHILRT